MVITSKTTAWIDRKKRESFPLLYELHFLGNYRALPSPAGAETQQHEQTTRAFGPQNSKAGSKPVREWMCVCVCYRSRFVGPSVEDSTPRRQQKVKRYKIRYNVGGNDDDDDDDALERMRWKEVDRPDQCEGHTIPWTDWVLLCLCTESIQADHQLPKQRGLVVHKHRHYRV